MKIFKTIAQALPNFRLELNFCPYFGGLYDWDNLPYIRYRDETFIFSWLLIYFEVTWCPKEGDIISMDDTK